MTHTVNLDEIIEKIATEKAALRNVSVDDYLSSLIVDSLRLQDFEPIEPGSLSGAEIIEYWKRNGGFVDMSNCPDSPEYARQIRQNAEARQLAS